MSALPPLRHGLQGRIDAARVYGAGAFALSISLLLYLHSRLPFGLLALAAAAVCYCALTYEGWRDKPSARIAALIFLAIFVLLGRATWDASLWGDGLTRYRSVIALLFGMALLQRALKTLDIGEPIRVVLARADSRWVGLAVIGMATLLTLPLGVAAVPIVTGALAGVVVQARDVASLSMRMFSLSMYIVPTTVASAAVNSSIVNLQTADVLLLGAPLFILGILLSWNVRPQVMQQAAARPDLPAVKSLVAAFIVVFVAALAGGAEVPAAVGLAGCGAFLLNLQQRHLGLRAGLLEAAQAARGCSAEVILIFACGVLACALKQVGAGNGTALEWMRMLWAVPGAAYGLLLVLLPLISMLGIHPLVLFNVFFPLVDNALLGTPAAQYIAWVSMFALAQLLSPVSISAILAASTLGLSPAETSYKLHYRFAAALAVTVLAYLLFTHGGQQWGWTVQKPA